MFYQYKYVKIRRNDACEEQSFYVGLMSEWHWCHDLNLAGMKQCSVPWDLSKVEGE